MHAPRVFADLLALAARPDVAWTPAALGAAWAWAQAVEGVDAEVRQGAGDGGRERARRLSLASPTFPTRPAAPFSKPPLSLSLSLSLSRRPSPPSRPASRP